MDDLASSALPDGIVVIPSAGGLSSSELIAQQAALNRKRSTDHANRQIKNLTFKTSVQRVDETVRGILDDLHNSSDHSVHKLFVEHDRLQGIGILLMFLASGGLLIDAFLSVRST